MCVIRLLPLKSRARLRRRTRPWRRSSRSRLLCDPLGQWARWSCWWPSNYRCSDSFTSFPFFCGNSQVNFGEINQIGCLGAPGTPPGLASANWPANWTSQREPFSLMLNATVGPDRFRSQPSSNQMQSHQRNQCLSRLLLF
jgi:hypothetical protein